MIVGVHNDLGRPLGRLERGEAVLENRDLKCRKRNLRLRAPGLRCAQRAVVARRQECALLAVDRVDDLLAPQLLEAQFAHRDSGSVRL